MNEQESKSKIAVQWIDYPPLIGSNRWGDYNQIVSIYFRPPSSSSGVAYVPLRFKINKQNGQPTPMTEEEFRDACVDIVLVSADKPAFVER